MSESTATPSFNALQLKQLRQLLTKHFSLEELRTLSFDLGIDFDEIGGETKSAKVREFIRYAERQGRLDDLLAEAAAARPALPWPISASAGISCPYFGLAAFREKDASFFFGREAFTRQLLEAVQQQSLVHIPSAVAQAISPFCDAGGSLDLPRGVVAGMRWAVRGLAGSPGALAMAGGHRRHHDFSSGDHVQSAIRDPAFAAGHALRRCVRLVGVRSYS